MKKFIFYILVFSFSLFGDDFIVAAAANMQFALDDLNREYTKESGKFFKIVISSSGKLTTQIQNGAPFSIFLSADMDFPKLLHVSGHAVTEPRVYARGTIVIWTLGKWDLEKIPFILKNDELKSIVIANPDTAPYGKEAIRALEYYKVYEKAKPKLVYAESISQVNQYIISKSADIGFTAKSVVTSPTMLKTGVWVELNDKAYNPIQQGVVVLKYGLDNYPTECKNFYNFLFSKKGKAVLKKYGYLVDGL